MIEDIVKALAAALASGDHVGLLLFVVGLGVTGPLALVVLCILLVRRRNGNGASVFTDMQRTFIDERAHHKGASLVNVAVLRLEREIGMVRQSGEETTAQLAAHLADAEPAMREFEGVKATVRMLDTRLAGIEAAQLASRDTLTAIATKLQC